MPPLAKYDCIVCTYIFSSQYEDKSGKERETNEINSSTLFASVYVDILHAGFALDEATPVKLALASLPDSRLLRVVSPAAAKKIAAIHAGRGPIA